MFRKQCEHCRKVSYSLSEKGRWICPGCGSDITGAPLLARETSTVNILPVAASAIQGAELN